MAQEKSIEVKVGVLILVSLGILAAFVLALVYAWGCQRPVRGGEGPQ